MIKQKGAELVEFESTGTNVASSHSLFSSSCCLISDVVWQEPNSAPTTEELFPACVKKTEKRFLISSAKCRPGLHPI